MIDIPVCPGGSGKGQRERRWLLLSEDGSHSWLGRATDPSESEISAAEAALRRAGVGGYLAVSEGDFWSDAPLTVLWVRDLAGPAGTFDAAVDAFMAKRRTTLGGTQ